MRYPTITNRGAVNTGIGLFRHFQIKCSNVCNEPTANLQSLVLEGAFKLSLPDERRQVERNTRSVGQRIVSLPDEQWLAVLAETIRASVRTRLYLKRKRLKNA